MILSATPCRAWRIVTILCVYRKRRLRFTEEAAPFYRYVSTLTQVTPELEAFYERVVKDAAAGTVQTQSQEGGARVQGTSACFGSLNALDKAKILCAKVYEHFTYAPGETNVMTTAGEAFVAGKGVCQDYAHVLITLCRMAGMPASAVCL